MYYLITFFLPSKMLMSVHRMRVIAISSATILMVVTSATATKDTYLVILLFVLVRRKIMYSYSNIPSVHMWWDPACCEENFWSTDIDECMDGTAVCDSNADCVNELGSYDCVCKDGYTGNGSSCVGKDQICVCTYLTCLLMKEISFYRYWWVCNKPALVSCECCLYKHVWKLWLQLPCGLWW